jgi:hypothetical protein
MLMALKLQHSGTNTNTVTQNTDLNVNNTKLHIILEVIAVREIFISTAYLDRDKLH